ncbi:acyl-[acyl-carrier-protein] thioesterase [Flavobacterium sp. F-380]|uniref:Acyl-[acyl-carrier-protein] thioesterase n=1 Tax=Flavobacterium kayseriense TaxID=2764714 RepID=A0ABR7JB08_9FLAO|nr:acyl-ACP thioesterase domain-containing protein [Flavobacterium kayseriense]MBC5842730.1 acyl-[acyl-carrier-protein] thioesterase [Flavobacterium kayseriense]MBC5849260.1 acyl-[acyl-carrier-protein] thioesterase [Flavobacterium kayseriense]
MPISPNFSSVFSKEWEINFTQCLPNGYLKYTDLCNILQLTAVAHSDVGGISFSDMQEYDQAWVLSRMRVEVQALPKWRDVITVKTWINTLENSRSVRALEMYINDVKIVGCETFWAVFNTQKRRPEALALPYDHFELYPELRATTEGFSKIKFSSEKEMLFNRKVNLSDLDIVNHVNNVKYLEWCLDLVDTDLLLKQKIKSFEMNFLKELSIQDQVIIHENESEEATVFSITKEDNTCFALQLNW